MITEINPQNYVGHTGKLVWYKWESVITNYWNFLGTAFAVDGFQNTTEK